MRKISLGGKPKDQGLYWRGGITRFPGQLRELLKGEKGRPNLKLHGFGEN